MDDLLALETRLGVDISDYALLATALTHRSYLNENEDVQEDNERLEFLGDAVIDLIVAEYLFREDADMREGEMTSLRAALVRAETLARFAQSVGVDEALRLGYGEAENGGRHRVATLCAAFEAVVGALYLDIGFQKTKTFVETIIAQELTDILANDLHKDARSEFQVWSQATFNATPRYAVVGMSGPDHERQFTVQVTIGEKVWGEGIGRSKQTAAHAAAREAMKQVDQLVQNEGS
ncbi:MAG: ribonuclease III [Ardenticatenaceae bacterium]|nr:ribonuclease III [Ardenticatenaceae bacterium]